MKQKWFSAFFFISMLLANVPGNQAIEENAGTTIVENANANIIELETTESERRHKIAFYRALDDPNWKNKIQPSQINAAAATAATDTTNAATAATAENEASNKAKTQYRLLNLIEYDQLLEAIEKACKSAYLFKIHFLN
jgi:hypothetical protein